MNILREAVAIAVEQIKEAGAPKKGKHWIARNKTEAIQVVTVYSNGSLFVNREVTIRTGKSIKDGKFDITCGISGFRLTSFGTKRAAKTFVDLFGPTWKEKFESIFAAETIEISEALHLEFATIGGAFRNKEDMGEDDGDLPYEIAPSEFVDLHLAGFLYDKSCDKTKGIGSFNGHVFGGPCAVVRDGDEPIFVFQGYQDRRRGMFMYGDSKYMAWMRFMKTNGVLTVEEHRTLKEALFVK